MGSSTIALQDIVNEVKVDGKLAPTPPVGGWTQKNALAIANGVMTKMIAERFNWKWNSFNLPPLYTNSWQQDYASINTNNIGWLENFYWVDINNTSLPKPSRYGEAVKDLGVTSFSASPPKQVCWLPNNILTQGVWPGAGQTYTPPLGAMQTPKNGPTNILDANGNILVLTVYGVTGMTAPVSATPWNPKVPTVIVDGTCQWTVANPEAQGLRVGPLPPQGGVVYQINVRAQRKMVMFANLQQFLNPIPDDYAEWFRDGFRAFCYRNSPDAEVAKLFPTMNQVWENSMLGAAKQGDRERDSAMFLPERGIMAPVLGNGCFIGPANPYNDALWWGQ